MEKSKPAIYSYGKNDESFSDTSAHETGQKRTFFFLFQTDYPQLCIRGKDLSS